MARSNVYLAGAGLTSRGKDNIKEISAATKALLDAGITFDDVSHVVKGDKIQSEVLKAFDDHDGVEIVSAGSGDELATAMKNVTNGEAQSVLAIANTKSAVSFVFVSEDFLWRHPYLKDSSIIISQKSSSKASQDTLEEICNAVWKLRGWMNGASTAKQSIDTFELQVIGSKVPAWKDIEYRQDGRHRLGHNPGDGERDISAEDFEAVRASRSSGQTESSAHFKRKGGDRALLAKL